MRSKIKVFFAMATAFGILQLMKLGRFYGNTRFKWYDTSKNIGSYKTFCQETKNAGPITVVTSKMTLSDVEQRLVNTTRPGGRWKPIGCIARSHVAVLVPYRDRARELALFLYHIHPFLQRQQLDYQIFILEQSKNHLFNKGATVNAGFTEVISRYGFDCYIIHDVDVLPEDDRIRYECTDHPRHLATAISRHGYKLLYGGIFGGALAFTRHQFQTVNGFSNAYFGWGGEDDDLGSRVRFHGYKVIRYPRSFARYKTLEHKRPQKNRQRHFYFYGGKRRYLKDGLNSLKYSLVSYQEKPLFTHILIDLDKDEIMSYVNSLMTTRPAVTTPSLPVIRRTKATSVKQNNTNNTFV